MEVLRNVYKPSSSPTPRPLRRKQNVYDVTKRDLQAAIRLVSLIMNRTEDWIHPLSSGRKKKTEPNPYGMYVARCRIESNTRALGSPSKKGPQKCVRCFRMQIWNFFGGTL